MTPFHSVKDCHLEATSRWFQEHCVSKMQGSLRGLYSYPTGEGRSAMAQCSCIRQHHRGINSNYLYHTKHNIVEPALCHQKHKYAKHFSSLHSNCLWVADASHPTALLNQINFTEKHKERARKRSFSGKKEQPICLLGPRSGNSNCWLKSRAHLVSRVTC